MTNYNQVGQALCKDGSVPKIANCNSFGYNKVVKIENTQVNHVKRLCTGYNHDNVIRAYTPFLKDVHKTWNIYSVYRTFIDANEQFVSPGIL